MRLPIRAIARATGKGIGLLALLAAPVVLNRWLVIDDILALEAVAHASAESKDSLFLRPRGQGTSALERLGELLPRPKGGEVTLTEIPDRFVELLLEKPRAEPHVRRWFPRTFLWAPRLITDESGTGSLTLTMPDALTDWSVVGMSLSAEGAIGGDALVLETRLPVHAEIRAPDRLRVGDRIVVPVVAVNHTGEPRRLTLRLDDAETPLSLEAEGAQTVPWQLTAATPGTRTLTARLGDDDTVEHSLQVVPVGLPEHTVTVGALVPEVHIALPADTAHLSLTLLPARAALARAAEIIGPPADAFDAAFMVALGCHLGDDTLRRRGELALRDADERSIDLTALATRDCPEPSERQADWLLEQQRPDGSWWVPPGATLSQLLSLAALNVRTAESPRVSLRTAALLERHGGRIADPFSAAMVLDTGIIDERLDEHLRGILDGAIARGDDGLLHVTGPLGVRPDGKPATEIDVLAVAACVLPDLAAPIRATLAAALSEADGWGDGLTGLLVLRALREAPPLHAATTAHLRDADDRELGSTSVADGAALLSVDLPTPTAAVRLVVDGPTPPELSWRLESTAWRATPPPPPPGLSGEMIRGDDLIVGVPVELAVTLTRDPALSGAVLHHDLPAGVVPVVGSVTLDGAPLQGFASGGRLSIPLPDDATAATVRYRVVPTLSGDLSDGGVTLQAGDQRLWLGQGPRWRVAEPR